MNITTGNLSPTYFPMGDQAIVVQFENNASIEVSRQVQTFAHLISHMSIPGVNQLIPAFNNLTVLYNPKIIGYYELLKKLYEVEKLNSTEVHFESNTIHIPVVFGGEYGPDLEEISSHANLSVEEVIKLIHSKPFFVYMIGFIAGYPYGGDIDQRLAMPRRSNPRIRVKKGTIQIANNLTGICTMDSPSGWHLVGWTPMEIFNPLKEHPCILKGGDYIKYIPIDKSEAEQWNEKRQREWDQEWNS
ncbi:5-oxoprolinase subunit PxpB [Metabacillus litoralis]|uniref:5-oxoprolinase subunit PxpB n=1 Tax=Metabacillus litoralis TaxID=152268 RepID=UPI002040B3D3|nr:5-oxoprolinase subunit PxpB [Metabacillus litoralis]MCM3160765.1 5-oxoprolinase subunit PxpB [Metabacillus litoralis]